MASRYRERLKVTQSGGSYTITRKSDGRVTTYNGSSISYKPETCTDHLSPEYPRHITNGDLDLRKTTKLHHRMYGTTSTLASLYTYNGYAVPNSWMTKMDIPPVQNMDIHVTEAYARANPSTPLIDLPAEAVELLTDLPSILLGFSKLSRRTLRSSTKEVAVPVTTSGVTGGYVTYHFGIKPLLQLLSDLLTFEQLFTAHVKRQAKDGELVRISLGKTRIRSSVSTSFNAPNFSDVIEADIVKALDVWASYRFILDDPVLAGIGSSVPGRDRTELIRLYKRRMLGSEVSFSSLWEITPFSWLVDYYTNIGTWLDSRRGFSRYRLDSLCCMAHTLWTMSTRHRSKGSVLHYGGRVEYEYKQRKVGGLPSINLLQSGLTDHQKNILLSIAAAIAFARG